MSVRVGRLFGGLVSNKARTEMVVLGEGFVTARCGAEKKGKEEGASSEQGRKKRRGRSSYRYTSAGICIV